MSSFEKLDVSSIIEDLVCFNFVRSIYNFFRSATTVEITGTALGEPLCSHQCPNDVPLPALQFCQLLGVDLKTGTSPEGTSHPVNQTMFVTISQN